MTNESESARMFSVNTPGHDYEMHNMENGVQNIKFINKKKDENDNLVTIHDGTTNEALLQILIHRLNYLNTIMHSEYNDTAISKITEALEALEARTADRKNRAVEGTAKI